MVRVFKSGNESFVSDGFTTAFVNGLEEPKGGLTTLKIPCLEPSSYESFQTHSNEDILWEKIQNLPLLKLKLRISSSLMHQWESISTPQNKNNSNTHCIAQTNQNAGYHDMAKPKRADFVSQQITEKMKASNFPASLLRIGSWERVSRHEGDLVAKCYYAKKKLVWEFLERSLKRKIEIQWADILAIRSTIHDNEPAILELELKQPPTFHHEIDPQPRKHTNWRATTDFTEGQAPLWRRHYLKFPPGVLDRHYEKLLQCDSRLFELSQKPFPSLESSHFQQSLYGIPDFSLNLNPQRPQVYRNLLYPQQFFPNQNYFPAKQVQSYQPIPHSLSFKDSASPNSVMEFSHIAENPRMAFWSGQAADYFASAESIARNQVQGQFPIASTTPLVVSYQNNNYTESGNMQHSLDAHQKLIDNLDPTSMTVSEMEFLDDQKYNLEMVEAFSELINQSAEGSLGINNEENYVHDMFNSLNMDFTANEHSNDTAPEKFYPQSVPWMPHQVTDDIQHFSWMPRQVDDETLQPVSWLLHTQDNPMSQFRNGSSYYPMRDDFSTADNNNGLNSGPDIQYK